MAADSIFNIEETFTDTDDSVSSSDDEDVSQESEYVAEKKCIVFDKNLLELAQLQIPLMCNRKGCGTNISVTSKYVGTAVQLKWVCSKQHLAHRWCSQPKTRKRMTGDILMSAAILTSGNNFEKVCLLFRFFGLGIIAKTTHYHIQGKHSEPVIKDIFKSMITANLTKYNGKEIVLAGDGRMDSPGHSAQYCTYTLMEYESKDILAVEVIDKRMTDLKSTNMEKEGLVRGLRSIISHGIVVKELVTDASSSITAMMNSSYAEITHSYDTWHGAKNFGKKIGSVAAEKKNKDLRPWVADLINHFWYCSRTSDGNESVFLSKWRSILHHTVNVHEWALGDNAIAPECEHGILPENEDAKWLIPGSDPHMALTRVILDTRMLHTLRYYVNFRHTGELETFHEHILMYCAKRFAYSYPIYKARNYLAAIDYQQHKDRPILLTKKGEPRLHRRYSKRNGNWSAYNEKIPKEYNYIPEILVAILNDFSNTEEPLTRRLALSPNDPRLVQKTLATNDPPPTKELMEKQLSRFSTNHK